jgi:hypothetical protein
MDHAPEPVDRYVAVLDILGFKSKLQSSDTESIRDLYVLASDAAFAEEKRIARALQSATYSDLRDTLYIKPDSKTFAQLTANPTEHRAYPNIEHMTLFSDSLFIFGVDASVESLEQVAKLSNFIFQVFLECGLPIRGAIAHGDIVVWPSKNVFLGQGVATTCELEESLDIVGIAVEDGGTANGSFLSDPLPIPLKRQRNSWLGGGKMRLLKVPLGPIFTNAHRIEELEARFAEAFQEVNGSQLGRRYKQSEKIVSVMLRGRCLD